MKGRKVRHKCLITKHGIVYHRTIYENGNGCYHVVLPKDWVRDVGLEAGDQVMMLRMGNQLIISPIKVPKDALKLLGGDS